MSSQQKSGSGTAATTDTDPVRSWGPTISVSEWTLGDRETAIKRAARAGFTAIEPDAGPRSEWSELRDRLQALSLATPSLCWRWNEEAELGSPSATSRANAQRYLATALEQAVVFGAHHVVVVPVCRAAPYGGEGNEAVMARAAQAIREVLVDAPSAVGIALEALHHEESFLMNRLEQADRLRSDIGDRRVSLLADCFHMFHEEANAPAVLTDHRRHIGLVHLAARDRSFPRRGDAEVEGFLRAAVAAGYRGAMTIECIGSSDDELVEALKSVRELTDSSERS